MSKRTVTILLAILACVLLVTGMALAAPPPGHEIIRHVIGGGGGRVEQGIYTLDYTIGQPVVGTDSAGTLGLCSGFWCGEAAAGGEYEIYLPLILRG